MIEAIEALLTWTPGYSPLAKDSATLPAVPLPAVPAPTPTAPPMVTAVPAVATVAPSSAPAVPPIKPKDTLAGRWWSLHGDGDGLKIDSWEGEDQLDIVIIIWYNYIDHLLRIYFDLNGCGVRVWIHSNIEDPERPMENKHLATSKIWGSVL